jgi:hypothetical protein
MESSDTTREEGYVLGSTLAPFFGIAFLQDRRGMRDMCSRLLVPGAGNTSSA